MRRRDFITLLGGAAAAWPMAAGAQQREKMRRIGLLANIAADDPEAQARLTAFVQELGQLGWIAGRNVKIDSRWGAADDERIRRYVAELVALAPDVLVANSSQAVAALIKATRTVPIVFASLPDPVGAGFVDSLARPGGNITGFLAFEYGMSAKRLELLKEVAPQTTRVAMIRDFTTLAGAGMFGAIQAVAPSVGVELSPVDVRDAGEIERDVAAFARIANGGLVVTSTPLAVNNQAFVVGGGLISYGTNQIDQYRQAAGYVDRILKGEKPADLPVQAPTKYELVINLKTAKTLGLTVPDTLLARADEVIE
jgi:ABC-type uncharacterized transport system substrate-binding protein